MHPIRVIQLIAGLAIEGPSGGVARFVIELVRAFDRSRIMPQVVTIWDHGTPYDWVWCERLRAEGIPTLIASTWDEHAPYQSCAVGVRNLWRAAGLRGDIIHSHGSLTDLAAIGLKKRWGARALVRTVHSEREWPKRPVYGLLFPNLLYPVTFDRELAVSQQAAANLDQRPLAHAVGRRAQCIYNALNFQRFAAVAIDRAAKRQSLGLPVAAQVVGSVGRLIERKGYDHLLNAMPAVLAYQPDAWLLIVGEGSDEAGLREQARALGIANRVVFTGARSDVAELLSILDLYVSSSLHEGLTTTVLEAAATGLPIVATRISGNAEIITDGVTGLLAAPGDPQGLATAIVTMLANPDLGHALAAAAQRDVHNRFAIARIADQYADVYEELLAQGAHSGR